MAKNRHTFAKRQREIEKKRKAEEKRARRLAKNRPDAETDVADDAAESAPEADQVVGGTD